MSADKHGGSLMMYLETFSSRGTLKIIPIKGTTKTDDYISVSDDKLKYAVHVFVCYDDSLSEMN